MSADDVCTLSDLAAGMKRIADMITNGIATGPSRGPTMLMAIDDDGDEDDAEPTGSKKRRKKTMFAKIMPEDKCAKCDNCLNPDRRQACIPARLKQIDEQIKYLNAMREKMTKGTADVGAQHSATSHDEEVSEDSLVSEATLAERDFKTVVKSRWINVTNGKYNGYPRHIPSHPDGDKFQDIIGITNAKVKPSVVQKLKEKYDKGKHKHVISKIILKAYKAKQINYTLEELSSGDLVVDRMFDASRLHSDLYIKEWYRRLTSSEITIPADPIECLRCVVNLWRKVYTDQDQDDAYSFYKYGSGVCGEMAHEMVEGQTRLITPDTCDVEALRLFGEDKDLHDTTVKHRVRVATGFGVSRDLDGEDRLALVYHPLGMTAFPGQKAWMMTSMNIDTNLLSAIMSVAWSFVRDRFKTTDKVTIGDMMDYLSNKVDEMEADLATLEKGESITLEATYPLLDTKLAFNKWQAFLCQGREIPQDYWWYGDMYVKKFGGANKKTGRPKMFVEATPEVIQNTLQALPKVTLDDVMEKLTTTTDLNKAKAGC